MPRRLEAAEGEAEAGAEVAVALAEEAEEEASEGVEEAEDSTEGAEEEDLEGAGEAVVSEEDVEDKFLVASFTDFLFFFQILKYLNTRWNEGLERRNSRKIYWR